MFSGIQENKLIIVEMYDVRSLCEGKKFNIKNCEFVVLINGIEAVMTR